MGETLHTIVLSYLHHRVFYVTLHPTKFQTFRIPPPVQEWLWSQKSRACNILLRFPFDLPLEYLSPIKKSRRSNNPIKEEDGEGRSHLSANCKSKRWCAPVRLRGGGASSFPPSASRLGKFGYAAIDRHRASSADEEYSRKARRRCGIRYWTSITPFALATEV